MFPTNPFKPRLPSEASRGADSEELRARLCLGTAPAAPHVLRVKAGGIQSRVKGAGIPGTATGTGLSRTAGAAGVNPFGSSTGRAFPTPSGVTFSILCCPGGSGHSPGPLGEHSAPDNPPVLVDGKVVIPWVVQALLNPCLQVLGGDEVFGFLLKQSTRIIPLRVIPPCSQSSGSFPSPREGANGSCSWLPDEESVENKPTAPTGEFWQPGSQQAPAALTCSCITSFSFSSTKASIFLACFSAISDFLLFCSSSSFLSLSSLPDRKENLRDEVTHPSPGEQQAAQSRAPSAPKGTGTMTSAQAE